MRNASGQQDETQNGDFALQSQREWTQPQRSPRRVDAYHPRTVGLLEVAADAYGLDENFSRAAVEQRYKRFYRDYSEKLNEINTDIRELWRKRIEDNDRMDLIPFLVVAREQAREKRVTEFVKGLYEKARIRHLRKHRKDH